MLDKSFQEILCRLDNRINERSNWIIESIEADYVNISVYSPLSGITYIELPNKLKNLVKDLNIIKSNDDKSFLWCHIRHLNPFKRHTERITKEDKKMINDLNYEGVKFPVSKRDYCKIELKNKIYNPVFFYENELTFPVYISDQKFKNCMDFWLITNENKSHYIYIKNFNRFICDETKHKNKKTFANVVCNGLLVKKS